MRMGLGAGTEVERGVEMEMGMSWRLERAGIQTGMKTGPESEVQKGMGTGLGQSWVQGETGA